MATDVQILVTLPDDVDAEAFVAYVTTAATERGGEVSKVKQTSYSPELEAIGLVRSLSAGLKASGIDTVDELFALTWQQLIGPRFKGVVNFGRLLDIVRAGARQTPPRVLTGATAPAMEQVEMMPWRTTSIRYYGLLKHHGVDTRDQLLALDVIGLREVAPDGSFGIIHVIRNDGHKPAPLGPDRTMAELDPRQTGIYASWGFQPEDRIGDLTVGIIRERLTSRVDAVMMEAELAGILEMFEKEWFTTISE